MSGTDFKKLFLNQTPMLDLRAPVEFAKGAFPNTINIPLLTDSEREKVGTCYKQKGQDKAIELGHQIVSGKTKADRIQAWMEYFRQNPQAYLYCFRGGMRSHLVQQWLREQGVDVPLIKGGYKAMRNYLLDVFEQPIQMIRISGQTGIGKTDLLVTLPHSVDLEGLANHRGSAFGKSVRPQPSQINFENTLAIEILKNKNHKLIVEDEGHYIGAISLPFPFLQQMKKSPLVLLTCPKEERIERIYQEYVARQKLDFIAANSEKGEQMFDESMTLALTKIQKRLGGVRFQKLQKVMQQALQKDSEHLHKTWIADLLEYYYDPMYDYQIEQKKELMLSSGNKEEIREFLLDWMSV